jgi:hypothetical protein
VGGDVSGGDDDTDPGNERFRDAPVQDPTLFREGSPGAPPREPGSLPPVPRGLTSEEWAQTFYGSGASRRSAFDLGRGWLLAVLLFIMVAVFVVLAIAVR